MIGLQASVSSRFQIFEEWNEDVAVDWWRIGRRHLNEVIRRVNRWQGEGFGLAEAERLCSQISFLRRVWSGVQGCEGWLEELDAIEKFICSRTEE